MSLPGLMLVMYVVFDNSVIYPGELMVEYKYVTLLNVIYRLIFQTTIHAYQLQET